MTDPDFCSSQTYGASGHSKLKYPIHIDILCTLPLLLVVHPNDNNVFETSRLVSYYCSSTITSFPLWDVR